MTIDALCHHFSKAFMYVCMHSTLQLLSSSAAWTTVTQSLHSPAAIPRQHVYLYRVYDDKVADDDDDDDVCRPACRG